jgi:hypothetical protein
VLSAIIQDRIDVNRLLKQRGLQVEVKARLLTRKAGTQAQELTTKKIEMTVTSS